jgi:peptidoglycan/xylan/chitin deacetylase (PgdA/CDA1 family)
MSRAQPPFSERGGPIRGLLDLATGCYPWFLFGGTTSNLLPVFHLHQSDPAVLESRLAYLADNKYRTVTTDAIARFVLSGVHPGPRTVVLCFDDCWASLWTVAGPLLRRYAMSAVAFAIPGRVADARGVRPTIEEASDQARHDQSDVPFATWPELRQLKTSGLIDIQSHSYSHSAMFSGSDIIGFVTPDFRDQTLLRRPLASAHSTLRWLGPDDLGAPLYARRSRLSDALRWFDDEAARERCLQHVAASGGALFFDRPSWRAELTAAAGSIGGRNETPDEQERAILAELHDARTALEERLGGSVTHACLPWGIAGRTTRRALARTGHQLAFADRLFGRHAVAAGDHPHSLMRLHERFISCLPGRGRRFFFTAQ